MSRSETTVHVWRDATALDRPPDWQRADWLRLADTMLTAIRHYASPRHALIRPPGPVGGYGREIDGLEGFARTFLLAGFRIAGERGRGLDELADWYATGIAAGTDPTSPERWVRLDEHPQAKVEAASLALILDMTRPWIWDRLSPNVQQQVVEYLSPAVGDRSYPRINWVWFRLVVQTFLRSVGGPWSPADMAEDLATHDTFARSDGWMSDGSDRAYDHYVGWALHVYPTLWARMAGAADLAVHRRGRDLAALDRYLQDAVALVGSDGSPLVQGRSLIYRFAAAAPFWVGAMAGVPSLSPGQLRHAASAVARHFAEHGAPDERGLLTTGWHGAWPRLAQSYSGPGSPYWASKGFLGIALPEDHPVWTSPAQPLPVQAGNVLRAVAAPGWLVSGTRADGIVRVVNHGTDHATEGSTVADSPLYARLGYSTATAPVLDDRGWTHPVDQSVALIDAAGRCSHRAGMRTLALRIDGDGADRIGVAGSTTLAHWVDAETDAHDHGEGRTGTTTAAGRITVFSLIRGPWELRLIRVDEAAPAALKLRIGGWAVAGEGPDIISDRVATVTGNGVTSHVALLSPDSPARHQLTAGIDMHDDAGPLGRPVRVPWLDHSVHPAAWIVALVQLSRGGPQGVAQTCRATLSNSDGPLDVYLTWPDDVLTSTRLVF